MPVLVLDAPATWQEHTGNMFAYTAGTRIYTWRKPVGVVETSLDSKTSSAGNAYYGSYHFNTWIIACKR